MFKVYFMEAPGEKSYLYASFDTYDAAWQCALGLRYAEILRGDELLWDRVNGRSNA